MFVPILLLLVALLSAGFAAYGTTPDLAVLKHGLDIILWARRLEWPLLALAIVSCLALLALVVGGRRRAWWLLGLGPVFVLFTHEFSTNPLGALHVADNPTCAVAEEAKFVADDEWVVGVEFDGSSYAYPYRQLFVTPVVLQIDFDQKFLLMWSPYANRATAVQVDRDFRARDLEIVSMPANALLLYNTRNGQFVNALTGVTPGGEAPAGFHKPLAVTKTTWAQWRAGHPTTHVMMPTRIDLGSMPAAPVLPRYRLRPTSRPAEEQVTFVPATQPVAFDVQRVPAAPVNIEAGNTPVLIYRDPKTGALRCFERRVDVDLFPKFTPANDPAHPKVFMTDQDTGSGWSSAGVAVESTDPKRKGQQLSLLFADEGVYWGVMKFWYPDLQYIELPPPAQPVVKPAAEPERPAPVRRRRVRARGR